MAQIQLPILPLYLYRYRAITPTKEILQREISAINEPYLWCSEFTSLNDPMEGFYRPSTLLKIRNEYAKIAQTIIDKKSGIGIVSLSDTKENELMWTHYADNYSGICIEYYAQRLLDSLPLEVSLVHMAYGDEPPRVSTKDAKTADTAARKVLSQKKINWAYEREWRVLGAVGKLPIRSKDVIRSIFLGSRIAKNHRREILETFQGSGIDIYVMGVSGYRHQWKRIHSADRKLKLRSRLRRPLSPGKRPD